jgi:response regulator RpfG family c-di-GMP phosphodiesterase
VTLVAESRLSAVLAVDDEPWVLSALGRLVRPDGVRLLTATSGEEALRVLEEQSPSIGVLISDYAMPGMNGAELLHAVRLRWPDITRVLLTGNADLPAAARAVNEGQLSRLYTKPWQPDEFRQAVTQALEQHHILAENRRLRTLADEQARRLEEWNQRLEALVAERTTELERANARLQRGLLDTVRLLLTSLEQRLPQRGSECKAVARLAGRLAERAGLRPDAARWVQVAALVHDVGLTGLPDAILRRAPTELSMAARAQYQRHPALGQRMLSTVEELADMGRWIRHHHERWDGRGYPDRLAGEAIPLPSRIIALADAYLQATAFESGTAPVWRRAQMTAGAFDPDLLGLLDDELQGKSLHGEDDHTATIEPAPVPVEDLRAGMVLGGEVQTTSGAVLLRAGERLTPDHIQRLQRFLRDGALLTTGVPVSA